MEKEEPPASSKAFSTSSSFFEAAPTYQTLKAGISVLSENKGVLFKLVQILSFFISSCDTGYIKSNHKFLIYFKVLMYAWTAQIVN